VTEDKTMSKAMRQMLEQSGRVGRARGEAVCEPISDEACGPPHEHPDTGSAKPKASPGGSLEAALTRETGATQTLTTSNSRAARCGPACRVVWQGCRHYGCPLCRFPQRPQQVRPYPAFFAREMSALSTGPEAALLASAVIVL